MNYISLSASMLCMVLKNCIFNSIGKNFKQDSSYVFKFNSIMYILCTVLFFALSFTSGVSLFTAVLGVLFGIFTILSNVFTIKALSSGPMHITILVTTSSMLIPAVFGMILSNETPSLFKIFSMLMLIGFIYLGGEKNSNGKVSKKWIINCLITFFSAGIIGILQKIHQLSPHKNELFSFLFCAFACAFAFAVIIAKKQREENSARFSKKHYITAIICGICIFAMNLINLKLSGIIPSQIFFPLVNGGAIVLSSISSALIFREKMTVKQIIGLIGGIISMILICTL